MLDRHYTCKLERLGLTICNRLEHQLRVGRNPDHSHATLRESLSDLSIELFIILYECCTDTQLWKLVNIGIPQAAHMKAARAAATLQQDTTRLEKRQES